MFADFPVGMRVRVVEDGEDPESGWVGAKGVVQQHNTFDRTITIWVLSGNPNPDDGNLAWFDPTELKKVQQ